MIENNFTAKQQLNLMLFIVTTLTLLTIIFKDSIPLLTSINYSVSASPYIFIGVLIIFSACLIYNPLSLFLSSSLLYDKDYKCFKINRFGQVHYVQNFTDTIKELIETNTVSSLSDANELINKVTGKKHILFENAPLNIFLKGSLKEIVELDYKEHLVIPTLNLLHQEYELFPDVAEINKENYWTICQLYRDYFLDNAHFNKKTGLNFKIADTQELLFVRSEDVRKELPYFRGLCSSWDFVEISLNHLKEKDFK